MRLQRERADRYLLLVEEANSEYKALTERMEGQRNRIICIYRRRKRSVDVLLYTGEFPQIPGSNVYERYFQVL